MQLDDSFLEDIGLVGLGAEEQSRLLSQFRQSLELRVSTRIVESLSDEQLAEFEAFAPDDTDNDGTAERKQVEAFTWLERSRPDYADIVIEEIASLKQEIIDRSDDVIAKLA